MGNIYNPFDNPRLIPWPSWRLGCTWFVSPLYIMWCGRLVYRLQKLTLAKIDLKNRKSLMFNVFKQLFIYTMYNLHPSFDFHAFNSPKLHCFEITHTQSCVTLFLNLVLNSSGLMALYIDQTVETWWRIGRGLLSDL